MNSEKTGLARRCRLVFYCLSSAILAGNLVSASEREVEFDQFLTASRSGDTNLLSRYVGGGWDLKGGARGNASLLDVAIQNRHPRGSLRWFLVKGAPFNPDVLWSWGNREAWGEVLAAGKMPVKAGEMDRSDVSLLHIPPKTTCIVEDIKVSARDKWFLPGRFSDLKVIGIMRPGGVAKLYLPETITLLPESFAEGKTDLLHVSLSDRVLDLPERAFSGCVKMQRFVFPMSLTNIGQSAFKNSGLAEADLSICSNLKSIGANAFEGTPNLAKIVFPSSLAYLGARAFAGGSPQLVSVTLGENIGAIGKGAFTQCAGLRSITIRSDRPPVLEGNIRGIIPQGAVVRVRKSLVPLFLQTKGWDGVEILAE